MIHEKNVTDELCRFAIRYFQLVYEQNGTWSKEAEAYRICFNAIYYELCNRLKKIENKRDALLIKGFLCENLKE